MSDVIIVAESNLCVVVGRIIDATGQPKPNAQVVFEAAPTQPPPYNLVSLSPKVVYTDNKGRFYAKILKGLKTIVRCTDVGLNTNYTVPQKDVDFFMETI